MLRVCGDELQKEGCLLGSSFGDDGAERAKVSRAHNRYGHPGRDLSGEKGIHGTLHSALKQSGLISG